MVSASCFSSLQGKRGSEVSRHSPEPKPSLNFWEVWVQLWMQTLQLWCIVIYIYPHEAQQWYLWANATCYTGRRDHSLPTTCAITTFAIVCHCALYKQVCMCTWGLSLASSSFAIGCAKEGAAPSCLLSLMLLLAQVRHQWYILASKQVLRPENLVFTELP